ncbi:MAG TPA: DNA-3-methyladenine glycosylase I [Bacteroidia bacterium]|nr:DNA-3-methyladenine glycosylase I [Bacteroidia bacterium]
MNFRTILLAAVNSYCAFIRSLPAEEENVHRQYHDYQYGFPLKDDNELFCRLILEINQAGLSWTTILKKQDNFRRAYHNFDIRKVARYGERDFNRLMNDAGIIRNRLKITAAIENAKSVLKLQNEFGSFKKWIDHHHPMKKEEWVKLFKKTFRFTGGEIVNEFLMSTGYLPGAHDPKCPVYKQLKKQSVRIK